MPGYSDGIGETFTGCAASGRVIGFSTIMWENSNWEMLPGRTGLFHIGDRSQAATEKLASQIYEFVSEGRIGAVAFCRTMTGYQAEGLADETRLETILQLIPNVKVESVDNEIIREWSIRENLPLPRNMDPGWRGLVQIRSIELAQFQGHLLAEKFDRHR